MKALLAPALALALVLALVLALPLAAAAAAAPQLFALSSPAFADDAPLPLKYAGGSWCGAGKAGGNVSPPLAWSGPPPAARSFAVVMIDPDGRRGLGSVHWVAYGIAADRTALKEGEGNGAGAALVEGRNSRGTTGYTGPCGPPADGPHHYVIDVIALDLAPDALRAGLDRDQLLQAIAGHSLGPASLVARYRRGGAPQ